jgi:hypothetical protein
MWDFEHGVTGGDFDITYTVPSQCAAELARGSADIGITPAAAYASVPDLRILPGVAIASKRAVRVDVEPPAGATFTADVLLAVAQDGLSTEVTAGENASKHLQHTGVVRSLTRIGHVAKGAPVHLEAVKVPIDGAWTSGTLRAVVLVQDATTREVYGTGQLAF